MKNSTARACSLSVGLLALISLVGCASVSQPRVDVADTRPMAAVPVIAPPPINGAIFQSGQYRPLFEDHRARLVGDVLTVAIVEKVSATQSSSSSIGKKGSVSAGVTAVPFVPAASLSKLSAEGSANNSFEGKGATENTNDFSGTITTTVTGVLPNGHLLISGEKQIGVNANVDVLRFSGQVDPRSIQTGNTVPSALVANVRVEHRGRGATSDANQVGWLSRFFLNVLPI